MTIKLIKRNQQPEIIEKPSRKPSPNELLTNTQGWIEEFRARKARANESLISLLRRAEG